MSAAATRAADPIRPSAAERIQAVGRLLFHEARLIDLGRYEEWLALYADDARYWIPSRPEAEDPSREVSIAYDDKRRMTERIARLRSGQAYAQLPASRTCHVLGCVQLLADDGERVTVTASMTVAEIRRERQSLHAAWCVWELAQDGDELRIASKRIDLIASEVPLGNLSFIL